ncbi:hypothetical protein D3C71_1012010 [compost metagenome]
MIAGSFYFKMNAQTGAIYWSKYETTTHGYFSCMRYANGKYFLIGGTEAFNSMFHGKVMAVSSQTGNIIWQTPLLKYTYPIAGTNSRTYFLSATELHHGKLFITGCHSTSLSTGIYPQMPVLIGITESGNIFLERRIPLPHNGFDTAFEGRRIEYDMDDNVVITCSNNGPGGTLNDPNLVLIKMDTLGNILFSKEYEIDGDGVVQAASFNETPGSYVLNGAIHTSFTGSYTLKLDKTGAFQKCIGIQKPNTYYGNAVLIGYGNSDFRNGIHYFPNSESHLPSNDNNINNIILDEDLNFIQDCAETSELPVTITPLSTQLEALVLTQIPNTFAYQNGIIPEDLDLYISCDSVSLNLLQTSGCQSEITAAVSGFQYPEFHWSDGTVSTSNTLPFSNTDTVIVRVLDIRCCELIDTIVPVAPSDMTVSLPADTSFCLNSGQSFSLTPQVNNPIGPVNYLWNTNATSPALSVTSSGTYWVEISDGCISLRDSIQITVLTIPEIQGLRDTAICEGTFPVILNPVITSGTSILWENGLTTLSRTITAPGIVTLQVTNSCGTTDSTITITQTDLPVISLIASIDTCLHSGESILLIPILDGVTDLLWSNGTTGNQLPVSFSGFYTVYGSNSCGVDSASCQVIVRAFPELNLPATLDTCFEIGIGFIYTAQGSSGDYLWNSGSQTASELITQEGIYICSLTNECGTTVDSMQVNRLADLELYFPNDSVQVCQQQISVNLLQIETNYQYELFVPWTNHPAGSTLSKSGWYHIRAFNSCGELWDSIYVDLQNEQEIYMPNSFTPNNDGTNDQLEISTLNTAISSLHIFNRWGEEICTLQNNSDAETATVLVWDGNYSGLPCPDGVYQVQITYTNCFGIPTQFTGHIHLIR